MSGVKALKIALFFSRITQISLALCLVGLAAHLTYNAQAANSVIMTRHSSNNSETYCMGPLAASLTVASFSILYCCLTGLVCCCGYIVLFTILLCFDIAFFVAYLIIAILLRPSASAFCNGRYYVVENETFIFTSYDLCQVEKGAYGTSIALLFTFVFTVAICLAVLMIDMRNESSDQDAEHSHTHQHTYDHQHHHPHGHGHHGERTKSCWLRRTYY